MGAKRTRDCDICHESIEFWGHPILTDSSFSHSENRKMDLCPGCFDVVYYIAQFYKKHKDAIKVQDKDLILSALALAQKQIKGEK